MAFRHNTVQEHVATRASGRFWTVQQEAELSSTFTESSYLQNNPIPFRGGHMSKISTYVLYCLRAKYPVLYMINVNFFNLNVSADSAQEVYWG